MKRTIFGVMLMIIGAAMFVTATTLFAVSAQVNDTPPDNSITSSQQQIVVENKVYTGDYYLNGDSTKDFITISDDTLTFSDGTVKEYTFTVWKDMPETDEKSGLITYVDYCFLKIDGEKFNYDPIEKELIFDNKYYQLLG